MVGMIELSKNFFTDFCKLYHYKPSVTSILWGYYQNNKKLPDINTDIDELIDPMNYTDATREKKKSQLRQQGIISENSFSTEFIETLNTSVDKYVKRFVGRSESNNSTGSSINVIKFLDSKNEEIMKLCSKYPDCKSLIVDFEELFDSYPPIADQLIDSPSDVIQTFEEDLNSRSNPTFVENPEFHVRFTNLPEEYNVRVRDISSRYISKLIRIEGIITAKSDILHAVKVGYFVCNRCGEFEVVRQDIKTHYLKKPIRCQNCERRDFRFIPKKSTFIDIRRIEIQESLEFMQGGEQAARIMVLLDDDMCNIGVLEGHRVVISGIPILISQKNDAYSKFVYANNIEVCDEDFYNINIEPNDIKEIKKLSKDSHLFDKLVNSIAPNIYGYKEIKEAIVLQLFGGGKSKGGIEGVTTIRDYIHILLIGEPGIAKTKLLTYIDYLAPKSMYIVGSGSSAVGLTATTMKKKDTYSGTEWGQKAGVLVLCNGGIACVDQLNTLDPDNMKALEEAMDKGTVSVAKAGEINKFRAKTSILAAGNPRFSRFDSFKPIVEQFDIPPVILDRFDLIFPIRDIIDETQDRKISKHILDLHIEGEKYDPETIIPIDLFRKYISYARQRIIPKISKSARKMIDEYYITLRQSSGEGAIPITVRREVSLITLSEASAKVRLSETVEVSDVQRAIELMNFYLREIAMDSETGKLDIDRVITEHPKSNRDKIRIVEDIIKKLVEESDDELANCDDVLNLSENKGLEKTDVEKTISELKNKGIIYEPKEGRYGWVP